MSKLTAELKAELDAFIDHQSIETLKQSAWLLIVQGASPTAQSTWNYGNTFLHLLVTHNQNGAHDGMIKQLLERYPNMVDVKNTRGHTPLQVLLERYADGALSMEDLKHTARLLSDYQASLTAQSTRNNGETLLHILITHNKRGVHTAEIEYLLQTHQNLKLKYLKDGWGYTPLQRALEAFRDGKIYIDDLKRIGLLLSQSDASLTVQSTRNQGETFLHVLALTNKNGSNDEALTQLLNAHSSLVDVTDAWGRSTLQVLLMAFAEDRINLNNLAHTALLLSKYKTKLTVQSPYNQGDTLLHILVRHNRDGACNETIEQLLTERSSLAEVRNSCGYTPLQVLLTAFHDGRVSVEDLKRTALLLSKYRAVLSTQSTRGQGDTLLHILVSHNQDGVHNEAIEQLLTADSSLIEARDSWGYTPLQILMEAFYDGHVSMEDLKRTALLLSKHHAMLSTQSISGQGKTILHILVSNNAQGMHDDAIKQLLIAHPGLANAKCRWGYAPLEYLLDAFYSEEISVDELVHTTSLLIKDNVDLHVRSSRGEQNTILHFLNLTEDRGAINTLLAADPTLRYAENGEGNTPLQADITYGVSEETCIEWVDQWVELRSDVACVNALTGETLLHTAVKRGFYDLAFHLIDIYHLDVHCVSNQKETLLHYMAKTTPWNETFARYLLAQGLTLDVVDIHGNSLLHSAVTHHNLAMANWLLPRHHYDLYVNHEGMTALSLAKSKSDETALDEATHPDKEMYELLKKHQVDQSSPLAIAIVEMFEYGVTLEKQSIHKGHIAKELAYQLLKQARPLLLQEHTDDSAVAFDQNAFLKTLHSKDAEMAEYRLQWDTIIKNILIALTGIGVVLIAAKLAYSYATQGRPLFFFQQEKTTAEEHLSSIEVSMQQALTAG